MSDKNFVHLHVHTEYSLLDGAAAVLKLIDTAAAMKMPAIALTDHGNMYAAIKFYNRCKEKKIKPIIGCECYIVDDHLNKTYNSKADRAANHLVLLAKDYEGFMNLSKLNSVAFLEGQYFNKPRIDLELLRKHSKGLICLSACIAGTIPRLLLDGDYEGALSYAKELKDIFEEGDFYIELQNHGLEDEKRVNPLLITMANTLGLKCVATNDVHYIKKTDAEMHDALLCIQTASYIDDKDRLRFPNSEFYLKSKDEMKLIFPNLPEALETPYEIAEKCNIEFEFNQYKLPSFSCPDNMPPTEYLKQLTYEGLRARYGEILSEECLERTETELNIIISMGFAEYYLIVWDFIFWAKSQDIPVGPGRGSGVGSIVAYAIGITDVDPVKYGLLFERFLNKDRTSMPDFDIDLCYNRRSEVIEYVKNKYGEDHISQIITFGTMQKKGAIRDVARVYRLAYQDVSKIIKEIPNFGQEEKHIHIQDLLNPASKYKVDALINFYNNNDNYKKILDIAMKVEGLPRNTSVHAAGVVIYKDKAIDTIPLAKNSEGIITTQFDLNEVEKLGLLKMDFLALMTLTDLKMAHDSVKKSTKIDVDFNKLGYDDPAVYEMIGKGNTDAVFQLEGGGMKKFMINLKPENLEDIIAGISIYRPGPMDNQGLFLKNRKNPDQIVYKHPLMEPILKVTSGIMVYQEQAMMVARKLANYSLTQADNLRAIFSKKKVEKLPIERQMFIHGMRDKNGNILNDEKGQPLTPGCIINGIEEKVAEDIFQDLEKFAHYAFNKSHAAAYAVLAYMTAYYRNYYPIEYMAAVVNNRIDKPDDIKKYMQVLKNMNITVLSPDINKSSAYFAAEGNNGIRYGLGCIKNVGMPATKEAVILERDTNGPFKSFYEFIKRIDSKFINKSSMESLIFSGAFDCFNETRATLISNYEKIIANVESEKKSAESGQINIFCLLGDSLESSFEYVRIKEFNKHYLLSREKEMLKMYISGHPLSGLEEEFSQFNFNSSMLPSTTAEKDVSYGEEEEQTEIEESSLFDNMHITTGGIIASVQKKRTKDGSELAVLQIEDLFDRFTVIVMSRSLEGCKNIIDEEQIVKIKGTLSIKDNEYKIYANKITSWNINLEEKEECDFMEDDKALYFLIDEDNICKFQRIIDALKIDPGPNEVFMQYQNKMFATEAKVRDLEKAAQIVQEILGPHKAKIKNKIIIPNISD